MKIRTRERLAAAALTALTMLLLLGLARTYHTRPQQHAHVALRFAQGYSAPPTATAPAVRPERLVRASLDPARIPALDRAATAMPTPEDAAARAPVPLALQDGPVTTRTAPAPVTRRMLLPRPKAQGRLALTPTPEETPVSRAPTLPRPKVAERKVEETLPVPMPAADTEPEALSTDAIMEWMQLRPGPLPPGIRRHIEYREGSLTASTKVDHDGVHYELYLMVRQALRELHVVLVADEASYYLIDRSFQREGRSFRTGVVRRSGGVISGIVSEERAAGSAEAQHFYQVFLSWWDAEQLRLQQ